ncbi:hypothetical protein KsCSTR_11370 [Candidatus Kuenenia stuttgartiensis]|jgi:hypothetical protein|uniref:Uncharacterized protein n=1 Tax=Kuenenia stuttgartiensis TaxID=174633 RepID=Q1PYG2_KUEST|nr:hypothetical protein KsCSTR_11370 [Candidatus Kuenenia stuttgartiensis]TVL95377.1 MAG: hypothetical protein CV080_11610 [Candidatus Kuenenia stuttgartiensis]CAJ72126.1 unknown protein [Candidatus Kuenenia stuttgartiensis]SOH03685.1 hypothetical protein KSMBR1_1182 [Candidatus Kuenenia stuttgartiensis]
MKEDIPQKNPPTLIIMRQIQVEKVCIFTIGSIVFTKLYFINYILHKIFILFGNLFSTAQHGIIANKGNCHATFSNESITATQVCHPNP